MDHTNSRRVAILGLGGTIAMTTISSGGVAPALSASELAAAVPGLADLPVGLETVDVCRLPGASLGFAELDGLRRIAGDLFADGVDGVVVTQGTDTIEETAYLLDLAHRSQQPIVVTGAMRNPVLPGADGPANLLAAVATAASPAARGLGCLVVFADEIHLASRVRKTHSTSPAAFRSPDTGPVGHLVEGRPTFLSHPIARLTLPLPLDVPVARVGLYPVALGDDDALLRAVSDRLDGLVVAGFGAGHVPEGLVPALGRIAARIPVVLASRTGSGTSLGSTYAFRGSESDLLRRGLIRAGFLDPYKARILLRTLLCVQASRPIVEAALAAAGGYAGPETWPWPILETSDHPQVEDERSR